VRQKRVVKDICTDKTGIRKKKENHRHPHITTTAKKQECGKKAASKTEGHQEFLF
jgi:hypothetical protein